MQMTLINMNDDMKLFKVFSLYNWPTDYRKYEMKVFGDCPSLKGNCTPNSSRMELLCCEILL